MTKLSRGQGNNFVGGKHGLHHLKCDLVLNVSWCVVKIEFEHFMHDFLKPCTITSFCLLVLTLSTKTANKYMVPKLNVNLKFKLSLGWFIYVDNRNLNNNEVRKIKALSHNIPKTMAFLMHIFRKINT